MDLIPEDHFKDPKMPAALQKVVHFPPGDPKKSEPR